MRRILTGVAALLGLALMVAGMPALLVATADLGAPAAGWSVPDLLGALSRPDDGTLAILLFKLVGWITWGILTTAILVEVVAALGHLPAPRLPGLALPQHLASRLVATAATLFIVTTTGSTGAAPPAAATPAAPTAPVAAADAPARHQPTHGGQAATSKPRTVVVDRGDTLSQIALETTGRAANYPKLFQASRHTRQPGGRHLDDPDLILPGWTITIPDTAGHRPPTSPKPNRSAHQHEGPAGAPLRIPAEVPDTAAPPVAASSAEEGGHETVTDRAAADDPHSPSWLLSGLAGAGALLAGALWLALRRRRAAQRRSRRPGRTITAPRAVLAPVEKTLIHQGSPTGALVVALDETLRRLAATMLAGGQPLPRLVGVDLDPTRITLRLQVPQQLPAPWAVCDEAGLAWQVNLGQDADLVGPLTADGPAPWPQLVTLGADRHGWRLVNLEALGVVSLLGASAYVADLIRYLVTELAIAPWAAEVDVDCLAIGGELVALAPDRIRHHDSTAVIDDQVAAAVATIDRLNETGLDLGVARADQALDQTWPSRVLVTAPTDSANLDVLTRLIIDQPGRSATSVLLIEPRSPQAGIEVRLSEDGRVRVPALSLDLVANGLTEAEARGCAALLAAGTTTTDTAMPAMDDTVAEWAGYSDEAGLLLPEFTVPRGSDQTDTTSLLPNAAAEYVATTANTAQDVNALAPLVPVKVTELVQAADPTLDADVAAWFSDSCDRPRLQILGPVKVRLSPAGKPSRAAARPGFYTEIVAFLATKPSGATTGELADALGITPARVRRDLTTVRAWLGTNPASGRPHLPEATKTLQAEQRGVGIYLIEDLLTDFDLFRRLRLRGQTRGADGLTDLRLALRLVNGAPFDDLRARGGLWLADSRLDQHLLCAVVDVAHLVATAALHQGDTTQAQAAAELAALIAPDEATPALDLAAVAARNGQPGRAARIARSVVTRHGAGDDGPLGNSPRNDAILRAHRWLEQAS